MSTPLSDGLIKALVLRYIAETAGVVLPHDGRDTHHLRRRDLLNHEKKVTAAGEIVILQHYKIVTELAELQRDRAAEKVDHHRQEMHAAVTRRFRLTKFLS